MKLFKNIYSYLILLTIMSPIHSEELKDKNKYYFTIQGEADFLENQTGSSNLWGGPTVKTIYDIDKEILGGSIGLGYFWKNNMRSEISYKYIQSKAPTKMTFDGTDGTDDKNIYTNINKEMKRDIHSLRLGTFYDFKSRNKFTPYVGGTLTYNFVKSDGTMDITCCGETIVSEGGLSSTEDKQLKGSLGNHLGYFFTLGVSYDLNKRSDIFYDINYGSSFEHDKNGFTYDPMNKLGMSLGLRVKF